MSEIENLRKEIDQLDEQIVDLFLRRMSIVEEVVKIKVSQNSLVQDQEREKKIIKRIQNMVSGKHKNTTASIFSTIMRISRGKQYEELIKADKNWVLGKNIKAALGKTQRVNKVGYLGKIGSNSWNAAEVFFPKVDKTGFSDFTSACSAVCEGLIDSAVLPLDNSTSGTVNEVYELLLNLGLYIVKTKTISINHSLLGLKGSKLEDINLVVSHEQGLMQCNEMIKISGWKTKAFESTSGAAEFVAKSNNNKTAAIASIENAEIYGLDVLVENINNSKVNQTRFIAVSKDLFVPNDAERVSIAFTLPHETGALASILGVFADFGLNLAKIQSRPIPDKPWEYCFYLDFLCKAAAEEGLVVIYQLEKELPFFKFLGWYVEV